MMKLHVFTTIAWSVAHARNAIFVAQYSNNKFGVAGRRVCFSLALSENCPKTRYKQSVYKSMKRDTGKYLINDVTKPILQKRVTFVTQIESVHIHSHSQASNCLATDCHYINFT